MKPDIILELEKELGFEIPLILNQKEKHFHDYEDEYSSINIGFIGWEHFTEWEKEKISINISEEANPFEIFSKEWIQINQRNYKIAEQRKNTQEQIIEYKEKEIDVVALILKNKPISEKALNLIFNLEYLQGLILQRNEIKALPESFRILSKNEYGFSLIEISNNKIEKLPELSEKIKTNILNLSKNKIKEIPASFLENLAATGQGNIEVDFSDNEITYLPKNITKFYDIITSNAHIKDTYDEDFIKLQENPIKYPSKQKIDVENPIEFITEYFNFLSENKTKNKISKEKQQLNTCIKQINIEKFHGIEKLHLSNIPTDTQWVFFTGENGYGKTSILQGIILNLFGKEDDGKILDKQKKMQGFIEFLDNNFNHVNEIGNKYFVKFENFAAYGASRLNISKDEMSKTYSLFNSDGKLQDIENHLSLWYKKENDHELYENISAILLELLSPYIDKIKIDNDNGNYTVLYHEIDTNIEDWKVYDELASGYKSIIAMFGDMILRLRKNQSSVKSAKDLNGIVIIDEFDLHLHPKWQRDLVQKLTNTFPNIQFIVSTHSPIPLLGAPPERTVIFNVNRTKEEGIAAKRLTKLEREMKYLTPNQFLTSDIFNMDEIENVYLGKNELDKVPIEDNYDDIDKNKKIQKELQELEDLANNEVLFPKDLFTSENS